MKYAEDTRYVDFSSCFFNIPLFSVATRSCESNSRVIQPKIGSSEIEKQPLGCYVTLAFYLLHQRRHSRLSYVYERDIKKILRIVRGRRLERYQQ